MKKNRKKYIGVLAMIMVIMIVIMEIINDNGDKDTLTIMEIKTTTFLHITH